MKERHDIAFNILYNKEFDAKQLSNVEKKGGIIDRKVRDSFICPICKKAKLIYCREGKNGRQAYFKSSDIKLHKNDCIYYIKYVKSITSIKEDIDERIVERKIENIMLYLLDVNKRNKRSNEKHDINHAKYLQKSPFQSVNLTNNIPKVNLNQNIDIIYYDLSILYYGYVKLEIEVKEGKLVTSKNQKSKYYILNVKIRNKLNQWETVVNVSRGGFKDRIDSNKVYAIALFGIVYKEKSQVRMNLHNRNLIKYKEI